MGTKAFKAELFDGLVSITPQEQLDAIVDEELDESIA
jgi:hypothetical protein